MSETDHIKLHYTSSKKFKVMPNQAFDELIKLNRQQALDSYRTALKKKIEDKIRYAEDQLSLMKLESCGYDKWQKIIDELKAVKHIIDSTTI